MTNPDHPRDPAVESALGAAFPNRTVEDVSPGGVSWNDQNETVRVDFDDGDAAYLKVAVYGDGSRIVRERAVVEYVDAHCEVAVPTVLESDASASPPYLATAPMDQANLAERWADAATETRTEEAREVGAALAAVHARTFQSHGHVVGGGEGELRLETGSWTDVLLDVIESSRERASSDRFDAYFDEVASAVEAHRAELDGAPAALQHGDPAQPNLFYGDAAVGFVDWELAHVGDPARERNRVQHQMLGNEDPEVVVAFRAGYRERLGSEPPRSESRTAIYDAIWHLDVLSAFEAEVRRADESEAELAAAREAEMERLLAAIRS